MTKKLINLVEIQATEEGVGAGCRSQEPIGISIIAGYLEQKGIGVNIVCPTLKNPEVTLERALEGNPRYVGLTCFMSDLPAVKEFSGKIKERDPFVKIIVGGNGVLTEPEKISMHPSFDYVVKGEGAYPLEDIINRVENPRGLIFSRGRIIQNNPIRMNLNDAGIPKRTHEIMAGRKRVDLTNPSPSVQRYAALYTSAGCNNHCNFCQTQEMFPGGINFRDPKIVLREVEECQEKYGTNYMLLMDPVALGGKPGLKSGHAQEIARLLHGTGMRFYGLTRLDMPDEFWDILQMAGVSKVGVGIESLIQKGVKDGTPEMQIGRINDYARKAIERGILCRGLFMVGYPGQNLDDVGREADSLAQLENVTDIRICWYNPFEKTQEQMDLMYARGEIYTADISKRDTNTPIFKIPGVPDIASAQALKNNMYRAFYQSGKADRAAKFIVGIDSNLKKSYDEFNQQVLGKIGCRINYT